MFALGEMPKKGDDGMSSKLKYSPGALYAKKVMAMALAQIGVEVTNLDEVYFETSKDLKTSPVEVSMVGYQARIYFVSSRGQDLSGPFAQILLVEITKIPGETLDDPIKVPFVVEGVTGFLAPLCGVLSGTIEIPRRMRDVLSVILYSHEHLSWEQARHTLSCLPSYPRVVAAGNKAVELIYTDVADFDRISFIYDPTRNPNFVRGKLSSRVLKKDLVVNCRSDDKQGWVWIVEEIPHPD